MLVFGACLLNRPSAAEPRFVKFATSFPETHPTAAALVSFAEALRRNLPPNAIAVQIFPSGQLGTPDQILAGLQFGNIEMGVISAELLAERFPQLRIFAIPYLFKDDAQRFGIMDGPLGVALLRELEAANLIGLGFLEGGERHLFSVADPFQHPQDVQNKTIGMLVPDDQTPSPLFDELMHNAFTALGATGRVLNRDDLKNALTAKEIHGVEFDLATLHPGDLDLESVHAMTTAAHLFTPDVIVASKQWFDTLAPEVQAATRKAVQRAVQAQRRRYAAMLQDTLAQLQDAGVVIETSAHEEFFQAMQPVYQEMQANQTNAWGDLLDTVLHTR